MIGSLALATLLLITIVAAAKPRWALRYFIITIPLFALQPVNAIGHSFTLTEFAAISLILATVKSWATSKRITIPRSRTLALLIAFLSIGTFSAMHMHISPPEVITHPYNSGSLDAFVQEVLSSSSNNITQSALRYFSISTVLALSIVTHREEIPNIFRWNLVGATIVGIIGVVFQISVLTDTVVTFSDWMTSIGFSGFAPNVGYFGPIPRMYSTVGEPGFVADYLLYTLAIALTLLCLGDNRVFDSRKLAWYTLALLILTVLTTSSTGYGGLLILILITGFTTFVFRDSVSTKFIRGATAVCMGGCLGIILLVFTMGHGISSIIEYQFRKLQFQAGSGSLRLRYLKMAFDILSQRPLFGIGFGSYYGASLAGTVVAESGLVGLSCLLAAIGNAVRNTIRASLDEPQVDAVGLALIVSTSVLILTNLLAKSITSFLFPWFWLSIALPIVYYNNTSEQTSSLSRHRKRSTHITCTDKNGNSR